MRQLKSLILLLGTILSLNALAEPSCIGGVAAPKEVRILGAIQPSHRKPVVSQCQGTCYFEGFVSVFESMLSHHLQRPLSVSRPHLFAELILEKIRRVQVLGVTKASAMSAGPLEVDFVSSGNRFEMKSLINFSPIVLTRPKNQSEVYLENKVMERMHRHAAIFLKDRLRELFPKGAQPSKQQFEDAMKSALLEALPEVRNIVYKVLQEHLIKEVIGRTRVTVKTDYIFPEFENSESGGHRLSEKTEYKIMQHLSERGELALDYFHILPYVRKRAGRPGFLELPEQGVPMTFKQALRKKQGGGHTASIVDVVTGEDGHIQYLVVRNSWASRNRSDFGHHYISVEYLHHYKADFLINSILLESQRVRIEPVH